MYEDRLSVADKHMTKVYDQQFKEAEESGLNWYPWVGKEYTKPRILLVGMSHYYKDGSGPWRKFCDEDPRPNRVTIARHLENSRYKTYKNISKMFIEGAKVSYGEHTRKAFWSSVAFLNFCQHVVKGVSGHCNDVQTSKTALQAAICILEPKLVLAWTTQLSKIYDGKCRKGEKPGNDEKPRRPQPRIIDKSPSNPHIVGILHPAKWYRWGTKRSDWLTFLLNDPASNESVEDFLQYLNNTHPTNP